MTAEIIDIETGRTGIIPSVTGPVRPTMDRIGDFYGFNADSLGRVYKDLDIHGRLPEHDARDARNGRVLVPVFEVTDGATAPFMLQMSRADRGKIRIDYFSAVPDQFSRVVGLSFNRYMRGC